MDKRQLRWNGWGLVEAPDVLGENADGIWNWLGEYFALGKLPETPATPLSANNLRPVRLQQQQLDALCVIIGEDRVMTDDFERAYHARGRGYHDLLYLRSGNLDSAPDAVVYPASKDEVEALLTFAVENNVALIPYGGGSSVVGGVTPWLGKGQQAAVTLDMAHMNRILEVNTETMLAHIEAGIYGPQLERALQEKGLTLGHYPQSFEYSTLGGWIASRGAGHQSNKYGKAEAWLAGATLVTPRQGWHTEKFPASAAGPMLRDLVPGSEGVLGIITDAWVKVHYLPEKRDYRAWFFQDFQAGVAAVRDMLQRDIPTAMVRLSDVNETFFYSVLHGGAEVAANGPMGFCLMLVGFEGSEADVDQASSRAGDILRAQGAAEMGASLGEAWLTTRFETPYLRDLMLDRGLGVDTIETAVGWDKLVELHEQVSAALKASIARNNPNPDTEGIVMSHVSHSYRDGASLYFTFVFPREATDAVKQWEHIKYDATEAIVKAGGTISHHHGVGRDHLAWMAVEKGALALNLLAAIKNTLDPEHILNPGKLLP